jgi:hypothetical protein
MRRGVGKWATDGATALRSRAFLTLLAILTLCATPLGTGDLFAASSHLFERNAIEAGHGDLPRRVAVTIAIGPTELAASPAHSVGLTVALDDSPDAIAASPLDLAAPFDRAVALPEPAGIFAGLEAGFRARAPPLN